MTGREIEILAFERQWRGNPAGKDHAIILELDMRPNHYYQRLNALLDDPEAVSAEPVVVNRLRRLRAIRRSVRRSA